MGASRSSAAAPARRRHVVVPAALAVVVLGLAGCGAAATSTSSGASGGDTAAVVDGVVAPQPAYDAGKGLESTTGGTARTGELPATVTADRAVVVVADTSVRVTDVIAATTALATVAARYAATHREPGRARAATACPCPCLPPTTKACAQQGTCPQPVPAATSRRRRRCGSTTTRSTRCCATSPGSAPCEASSRSSADVTAEVADVDARVRNAQASLARVRALMSQGDLDRRHRRARGRAQPRQADLEALQARQRTLADQTAQATVTVRLLRRQRPRAVAQEQTGFLAGLARRVGRLHRRDGRGTHRARRARPVPAGARAARPAGLVCCVRRAAVAPRPVDPRRPRPLTSTTVDARLSARCARAPGRRRAAGRRGRCRAARRGRG